MKKLSIILLFFVATSLSISADSKKYIIDILSPRKGDTVTYEDSILIKWKTEGKTQVKGFVYLYYSLNSGKSWKEISSFRNDGSAKWHVPKEIDKKKTVRLKAVWKLEEDTKKKKAEALAQDRLIGDFTIDRELLPDLVITKVKGWPMGDVKYGEYYDIFVTVKNIGKAKAVGRIRPDGTTSSYGYKIFIVHAAHKEDPCVNFDDLNRDGCIPGGGTEYGTEDLAPGEKKEYEIHINYTWSGGETYISTIVDPECVVKESNEDNNVFRIKKYSRSH